MTLERIEHKVFASEAPLDEMGQFGSALATTKLNTKDVAEIQALPAYTKGWGSAIISENNYPAMEEMNGVLNVMSYHTGYLYQEGIPIYSATQEYSATSWVKDLAGKKVYKSLQGGNKGYDLADTSWWEELKLGGSSLDDKITNCLLEVPQRLKLDLTDGVPTLKAGSVILVPNGFEVDGTTPKFDGIVIENDLESYAPNMTVPLLYFAYDGGNNDDVLLSQYCYSGESAPTVFQDGLYAVWYDTANNIVKRTGDAGATWITGYSLPFCSANLGYINRIFNGMGYIGSTVWVDKGVKGLIPNGRNKDGTLKNIEVVTTKVTTFTNTANSPLPNSFIINSAGSVAQRTYLGEFATEPTPSGHWGMYYNTTEHIFYYNDGGTWTEQYGCIAGTMSSSSTGIASFQPKQPFRAVDYNELKSYIVETYVNGHSWYRVWSDGFKEQGGYQASGSVFADVTVTFLKPFSDANYTFLRNIKRNPAKTDGAVGGWTGYTSKTATSVTFINEASSYGLGSSWYACGY